MSKYTIDKEEMAKLLGRPLDDHETENFDNLLANAKSTLEHILGIRIDGEYGERLYQPRPCFGQLWIDPFVLSEDEEKPLKVVINGQEQSVWPANFDQLVADWYNSIIFECPMGVRMVVVTTEWGFGDALPSDLQALWASLFDIVSTNSTTATTPAIESEQVLSHRVTFNTDKSVIDQFISSNAVAIARYKRPFGGDVRGL